MHGLPRNPRVLRPWNWWQPHEALAGFLGFGNKGPWNQSFKDRPPSQLCAETASKKRGETRRPLDETNIRLLQHLQQDARISVAELARRLRRSEATIRERIQFLETHGVVRGYRADVDFEKLGIGATAIVRGAIDLREVPKLSK